MSFQNNKELQEILQFIGAEDDSVPPAKFIQEQFEQNKLEPSSKPYYQLGQRLEENKNKKTYSRSRWLWAMPALAVIVTCIFLFRIEDTAQSIDLQTLVVESTMTIKRSDSLFAKGLQIKSQNSNSQLTVKSTEEHIYISLQKGEIEFTIHRSQLEKEPIFFINEAIVKTIGTVFSVKVLPSKSIVTLTEGSLLIKEKGKSSRYDSPASINIVKSTSDKSFSSKIIEAEKSLLSQKEPPERTNTAKITRVQKEKNPYGDKKVSIELKNGDRLSGVILHQTKSKLKIKGKYGILHIARSKVKRIHEED